MLKDIPLPPPSSVDLKQALKDAQREAIVLNGKIFKVRHSALTFTCHTKRGRRVSGPWVHSKDLCPNRDAPLIMLPQPLVPAPSTVPEACAASLCVCCVRATPRVWRRR